MGFPQLPFAHEPQPLILPPLVDDDPMPCCAEAQADGVPCAEIGDCEECGRALDDSESPGSLPPEASPLP